MTFYAWKTGTYDDGYGYIFSYDVEIEDGITKIGGKSKAEWEREAETLWQQIPKRVKKLAERSLADEPLTEKQEQELLRFPAVGDIDFSYRVLTLFEHYDDIPLDKESLEDEGFEWEGEIPKETPKPLEPVRTGEVRVRAHQRRTKYRSVGVRAHRRRRPRRRG